MAKVGELFVGEWAADRTGECGGVKSVPWLAAASLAISCRGGSIAESLVDDRCGGDSAVVVVVVVLVGVVVVETVEASVLHSERILDDRKTSLTLRETSLARIPESGFPLASEWQSAKELTLSSMVVQFPSNWED